MKFGISSKTPAVTLIWIYEGKNAEARRKQIREWNYKHFELIEADRKAGWNRAVRAVRKETDICIFWIDDDKPVRGDFLSQMTQPLMSSEDFGPVIHFWSGNAISVTKELVDALPLTDHEPGVHSLLKLLMPMLDATDRGPNGRIHLALSSIERLAPLSLEPVGFPC